MGSTIQNQPPTFGNSLPKAGANGLRPSDIIRYKSLSPTQKRKARERAISVLNNLRTGYNETSILPPHLIRELWYNQVNNGHKLSKLVVWDAYDGGTYFALEENSRNHLNTPCKLIHDE